MQFARYAAALAFLAIPSLSLAAEHPPMEAVDSLFQIQREAIGLLHPPSESPLKASMLDADAGTDIEILYQSSVPVPVAIGPAGIPEHAMMYAILPPSQNGDAVLKLVGSPFWNPWIDATELRVYWRGDAAPVIVGSRALKETGFGGKFLAAIRHPLDTEPFGSQSVNYLIGYRVLGLPLVVLFAIVAMIGTVALSLRRRTVLHAAGIMALGVLLLYHARFAFDVARMEAKEQAEWWQHDSYGEMGFLPVIVDLIKEEASTTGKTLTVAACTRLGTPTRYFLLPISTVTEVADIPRATHGIFNLIWNDDQTDFTCNGVQRSGEVITRFANGDALVRFFPRR